MLRILLLFSLLGVSLCQSNKLIDDFMVVWYEQTSQTADGTVDIIVQTGVLKGNVSPKHYVALGFQNGNAGASSVDDVSMYGPPGGGAEYFFLVGDSSSAYALHRYLNNSQQPATGHTRRKGMAPVHLQTLANASAIRSSDRIRRMLVTQADGGLTSYMMTVSCSKKYWTDLSKPATFSFALGTVDDNGEPQNHVRGLKGWSQTSSSDKSLRQFILCGPNAGEGPVIRITGSSPSPSSSSPSSPSSSSPSPSSPSPSAPQSALSSSSPSPSSPSSSPPPSSASSSNSLGNGENSAAKATEKGHSTSSLVGAVFGALFVGAAVGALVTFVLTRESKSPGLKALTWRWKKGQGKGHVDIVDSVHDESSKSQA